MFLCLYVLIMYVNFVCILLSLFYLYCVHIAFLYSNVRLSHNKRLLTNLLTYLLTYLFTYLYPATRIWCKHGFTCTQRWPVTRAPVVACRVAKLDKNKIPRSQNVSVWLKIGIIICDGVSLCVIFDGFINRIERYGFSFFFCFSSFIISF